MFSVIRIQFISQYARRIKRMAHVKRKCNALRATKFSSPDSRDAPRLHRGKLSREKNSVSLHAAGDTPTTDEGGSNEIGTCNI